MDSSKEHDHSVTKQHVLMKRERKGENKCARSLLAVISRVFADVAFGSFWIFGYLLA